MASVKGYIRRQEKDRLMVSTDASGVGRMTPVVGPDGTFYGSASEATAKTKVSKQNISKTVNGGDTGLNWRYATLAETIAAGFVDNRTEKKVLPSSKGGPGNGKPSKKEAKATKVHVKKVKAADGSGKKIDVFTIKNTEGHPSGHSRMIIYLPEKLAEEIRETAQKEETSVSEIIQEALDRRRLVKPQAVRWSDGTVSLRLGDGVVNFEKTDARARVVMDAVPTKSVN